MAAKSLTPSPPLCLMDIFAMHIVRCVLSLSDLTKAIFWAQKPKWYVYLPKPKTSSFTTANVYYGITIYHTYKYMNNKANNILSQLRVSQSLSEIYWNRLPLSLTLAEVLNNLLLENLATGDDGDLQWRSAVRRWLTVIKMKPASRSVIWSAPQINGQSI